MCARIFSTHIYCIYTVANTHIQIQLAIVTYQPINSRMHVQYTYTQNIKLKLFQKHLNILFY